MAVFEGGCDFRSVDLEPEYNLVKMRQIVNLLKG